MWTEVFLWNSLLLANVFLQWNGEEMNFNQYAITSEFWTEKLVQILNYPSQKKLTLFHLNTNHKCTRKDSFLTAPCAVSLWLLKTVQVSVTRQRGGPHYYQQLKQGKTEWWSGSTTYLTWTVTRGHRYKHHKVRDKKYSLACEWEIQWSWLDLKVNWKWEKLSNNHLRINCLPWFSPSTYTNMEGKKVNCII